MGAAGVGPNGDVDRRSIRGDQIRIDANLHDDGRVVTRQQSMCRLLRERRAVGRRGRDIRRRRGRVRLPPAAERVADACLDTERLLNVATPPTAGNVTVPPSVPPRIVMMLSAY